MPISGDQWQKGESLIDTPTLRIWATDYSEEMIPCIKVSSQPLKDALIEIARNIRG